MLHMAGNNQKVFFRNILNGITVIFLLFLEVLLSAVDKQLTFPSNSTNEPKLGSEVEAGKRKWLECPAVQTLQG